MLPSQESEMFSRAEEYVQAFWIKFTHEFPQWATCSRRVHEPGSMNWEIPSLREDGKPAMILVVNGFSQRITVGVGGGHIDLEDWHRDQGREGIFSATIQLIHEIVDEKWVGVTLRGGGALAHPSKLNSAHWAKDIVRVVSWKGTFDTPSPCD